MPYSYNIPLATDKLSISQGQIQGNFNALGAIAGNTNASSSSLNATSGFNWVYLPSNGSTPPSGSAFPAGVVALYGATNATTTRQEVYLNRTSGAGAGAVVQVAITASRIAKAAPVPGAQGDNTGWTMLPSGIKLVWGVGTGNVNSTITVTLAGDQAFATTILSVQCTIINSSASGVGSNQQIVRVMSFPGTNQFNATITNITGALAGGAFMFLAMGY